jgi:hypothetical protein
MSVLLCRSNMVLFFHPTVFFLEKAHSLLHREVSSTYHWRHAKKATPWCILPGISSLSTFHAGLLSLFICCVHLGQSLLPSLVTSISPLPCKSWGLANYCIQIWSSICHHLSRSTGWSCQCCQLEWWCLIELGFLFVFEWSDVQMRWYSCLGE